MPSPHYRLNLNCSILHPCVSRPQESNEATCLSSWQVFLWCVLIILSLRCLSVCHLGAKGQPIRVKEVPVRLALLCHQGACLSAISVSRRCLSVFRICVKEVCVCLPCPCQGGAPSAHLCPGGACFSSVFVSMRCSVCTSVSQRCLFIFSVCVKEVPMPKDWLSVFCLLSPLFQSGEFTLDIWM